MALERVQKILARAGIASRRKAEDLITGGEVTINGKVAKLGDKAEFGKDAIKVKGKLLRQVEAPMYLAFFKPKGVISMLEDPEGRPTLANYLEKLRTRVFPIGRLDFNSEGLLLLTNDGDFAEKLQRRDDLPRVYRVKIKGHPDEEMLARLTRAVKIGHRFLRPHSSRIAQKLEKKSVIEIVFVTGGAIDVKAFFEMKGFLVEKITRFAIGHLTAKGIVPGQAKLLKPSQAQALLEQPELGMTRLEREAEARRPVYRRNVHETHKSAY